MMSAQQLMRFVVIYAIPTLPLKPLCDPQEVKTAAAEAVKDLSAQEKKQVGLEERRKHANSKAKKLKKSLQDVSGAIFIR